MTDYTYTARFSPQAWIRDNAVEVDPKGPVEWDCTQAVRENLDYFDRLAEAEGGWDNDPLSDEILDNDDVLWQDPAAPVWVREWGGPFSIWVTRTKADAAVVDALREALDDLWGCIAKAEIDHLQPETVEIATANHELLHHSGESA